MKTRKEILQEYYVNTSDIQRLMHIPRKKAKEIFEAVDTEEQSKQFRAHYTKVPLDKVLNYAGVNYQFLLKQIKESEAR